MNLPNAIVLLDHLVKNPTDVSYPDMPEAVRMGYEGLKLIREFRLRRRKTIHTPLPGETVED